MVDVWCLVLDFGCLVGLGWGGLFGFGILDGLV